MQEQDLKQKYSKYLKLSQNAMRKARKSIVSKYKKEANMLLDMAQDYINDAQYFWHHDKKIEAVAALAYAHGWIDAASKLKFIDVKDNKLFVLP